MVRLVYAHAPTLCKAMRILSVIALAAYASGLVVQPDAADVIVIDSVELSPNMVVDSVEIVVMNPEMKWTPMEDPELFYIRPSDAFNQWIDLLAYIASHPSEVVEVAVTGGKLAQTVP